MKNCDEIMNKIYGYLDKELDELESAEFESHIKACQECRNELDETKRLMDICKDMPEEELPQDFRKGLHDRLVEEKHAMESKQKSTYIIRKYLAICSTVAAVLVIAIIVKGLPWNSPIDRQSVHSQSKTDYKKNQPETGTSADSKSPAYTWNDDNNTEKSGNTKNIKNTENNENNQNTKNTSPAKSKSQSASDYSASKSKRIVPPVTHIPASNEGAASKSSNKEASESRPSKKASTSVSDQGNRMMAYGVQEDIKTYQLKNISISVVSSNQSEDIEKIKSNFLPYSAEMILEAADKTSSQDNMSTTGTSDSAEIKIKVPNATYQQFIDYLNSNFSSAGIEIGELNVVDVTGQIKDYQDKVSVLSAAADKAYKTAKDTDQAGDKKTDDELLKVQNEMNELKSETEYTTVVIVFKN
ncbi:MAG TPA: zf-HC2 domain-containing protein [Clostridia bacterium]|nr:zf-HC2 domain-containing protein [Clostridia bacterium]